MEWPERQHPDQTLIPTFYFVRKDAPITDSHIAGLLDQAMNLPPSSLVNILPKVRPAGCLVEALWGAHGVAGVQALPLDLPSLAMFRTPERLASLARAAAEAEVEVTAVPPASAATVIASAPSVSSGSPAVVIEPPPLTVRESGRRGEARGGLTYSVCWRTCRPRTYSLAWRWRTSPR
jgi:hypothetical protein